MGDAIMDVTTVVCRILCRLYHHLVQMPQKPTTMGITETRGIMMPIMATMIIVTVTIATPVMVMNIFHQTISARLTQYLIDPSGIFNNTKQPKNTGDHVS